MNINSAYIIFAVLILLVILLLCFFIKTFNTLIKVRNRVQTQWAQVDVQLTRRADLIPNLIETVKGYTEHESETLEKVVAARQAAVSAGTRSEALAADTQMSSVLPSILALAEAYPTLKADGSFLNLQEQLNETENKIAFARQFFNDTVLIYNNTIGQFPQNIVAGIFGFRKENTFSADEESRQNPRVSF
ncbi:MAG: LemA family protein [Oscillospiraceae bacterium]|jgi:LemA protein|nr:LemA family protein [Oscillospiraceae bacterium]